MTKHLLVCATDAGGAANMVPVGSMAQAGAAASVLCSPSHTRDIFEQAGLACEEAQVGDPGKPAQGAPGPTHQVGLYLWRHLS